jgi:NAD-dependent dihydropyrimidine dehydrogenase PreA subunit
MAYVVTLNCLGTKDRSCVEVCPVDCFYNIKKRKYNERFKRDPKRDDDEGMLVINPDECIHCGACETECPVEAIMEDSSVPADLQEFIGINASETTSMTEAELDAARCTSKS